MNKIAKEHLTIGEKPAREALKKAGCYATSGKKGWFFDGDAEILEKSIYDFATVKATANPRTKKQISTKTKDVNNKGDEEPMNGTTNDVKNKRKRASFDIDVDLLKQLKVKAVLEEKNLYDLVEQAIKDFLNKK
ncbi:hypothetical protein [Bacillus cereus]|uniref:hypothetical protein n=1 Tax=Bacillus cereus TaxID=1396 RepID=UPI001F452450|nr:hypothetical protein [Bacillus cereus]BCC56169.1 hypothetical protein BCJMU07_p103 [Bacillus cereus]BCC80259.1 hypothetical protein BCJMU62_p51 [Bacillus cereus]